MKTLSKNITVEFFDDIDGYVALERRWREITSDREARKSLGCVRHLLYQMLRGKDWRKALTAPTNARKLANGYWWRGRFALWSIRNAREVAELVAPFEGIITAEAIDRLRERLPAYASGDNPLEKEPYLD